MTDLEIIDAVEAVRTKNFFQFHILRIDLRGGGKRSESKM